MPESNSGLRRRSKQVMHKAGIREADTVECRIEMFRSLLESLLNEIQSETLYPDFPKTGFDFYEAVAQYEAQLIEAALAITRGQQRRAAKLLRLGTSTLCTKIKQLRINPRAF